MLHPPLAYATCYHWEKTAKPLPKFLSPDCPRGRKGATPALKALVVSTLVKEEQEPGSHEWEEVPTQKYGGSIRVWSKGDEARGGCKIATANINTIRNHSLLPWEEADIWLLQETRHSPPSLPAINSGIRRAGQQVVWGKPMPAPRGRMMGPPGGVAILTSKGMALQELTPEGIQSLESMYRDGRWVAARVGNPATGGIIVCSVHFDPHIGYTYASRENVSKVIEDTMLWAAQFAPLPVIVGGDFNVDLQRVEGVPSILDAFNWLADHLCPGSARVPTTYSGSSLDFLLFSSPAWHGLCEVVVNDIPGIAPHKAKIANFAWDDAEQARVLLSPTPFPPKFGTLLSDKDRAEAQALGRVLVQEFHTHWNPSKAWKDWSAVVESWVWSKMRLTKHKKDRWRGGRGFLPVFKMQKRKHSHTRLWQPEALRPLRRAMALTVLLDHYQEWNGTAQRLWDLLLSTPMVVDMLRPVWPHCMDNTVAPPSRIVQQLKWTLQSRVSEEKAAFHRRCLEAWRRKLQIHDPHGKHMYKWLNLEDQGQRICFLEEKGRMVTDEAILDVLLKREWAEVHRRRPTHPEPDTDTFCKLFLKEEASHEFLVEDINLGRLEVALGMMNGAAAGGLDGWRPAELQELPQGFLLLPLALIQHAERTGEWPAVCQRVAVSLLKKEGPASPLNHRPISVSSVLYRLWGAIRWTDLVNWQRTWLHDEQFGFHPGRSCEDAAVTVLLDADLARASGTHMAVLDLDLAKAFDRMPLAITLRLAAFKGIPGRVFKALCGWHKDLTFRYKFREGFGTQWRATNGFPQGCCISCILMNMHVAVWMSAIKAIEVPVGLGVRPIAYADDQKVQVTATPGALHQMSVFLNCTLSTSALWAAVTDQEYNVKKCKIWLLNKKAKRTLGRVLFQGTPLPFVPGMSLLGYEIQAIHPPTAKAMKSTARLKSVEATAWRLRALPKDLAAKDRALAAKYISKAGFGLSFFRPEDSVLMKADRALMSHIWRGPSNRAVEAVMILHMKAHQSALMWAAPLAALRVHTKHIQGAYGSAKKPVEMWTLAWKIAQEAPDVVQGPVAVFMKALDQLGWSWVAPTRVATAEGSIIDLHATPRTEILHMGRDSLRRMAEQKLALRRPTFDAAGKRWDRKKFWSIIDTCGDHYMRSLLRSVSVGAVFWGNIRLSMGVVTTDRCEWCGEAQDSSYHWVAECPYTLRWRQWARCTRTPADWPPCFIHHGIPVQGMTGYTDLVPAYGMYLTAIHTIRALRQVAPSLVREGTPSCITDALDSWSSRLGLRLGAPPGSLL
jgi:hypothetical protein